MRAFYAPLLVLCLAGCQKKAIDQGDSSTVKLKQFLSKTDVLLSRRFFGPIRYQAPDRPTEKNGSITTEWKGGLIAIEPIIIDFPNASFPEVKGIQIDIKNDDYTLTGSYVGSHTYDGKADQAVLDLDEARDLSEAIQYFQRIKTEWGNRPPQVHSDVMFTSRDGLEVQIYKFGPGQPILMAIGKGEISRELSDSEVGFIKGNLEQAIKTLDEAAIMPKSTK